MHFPFILAAIASALTTSASCIHGTSFQPRQEGKVPVSQFGYTAELGPLNWAGLSPAYANCREGSRQSPIVLDDSILKVASRPTLSIKNVPEAELENLGTTLETIVNGTMRYQGKKYMLKQFHVHTPSEHRINEEYYPLELHMVHQAQDNSTAVIALLFQLSEDGSTTNLLTANFENIDDVTKPGSITATGALDFSEVKEAVRTSDIFVYSGSLTTPPCAEGITFLVVADSLPIDVSTYNKIKRVIKFNSRYTQNSLGQRNLLKLACNNCSQNAI